MIEFLSFLFYVTIVFFLPNKWWMIFGSYAMTLLYCFMRRVEGKKVLCGVVNTAPFILMTFVFNAWSDDLNSAIFVTFKLLNVFWATRAYAQTLSALIFAKIIEKVLPSMNKFSFNANEVGLIICLALSMIPILRREISEIKYAIRAKGMKLNLYNTFHVVLCLFNRLINRVDRLDMALRSKGIF